VHLQHLSFNGASRLGNNNLWLFMLLFKGTIRKKKPLHALKQILGHTSSMEEGFYLFIFLLAKAA
jgi:hypothetical protein